MRRQITSYNGLLSNLATSKTGNKSFVSRLIPDQQQQEGFKWLEWHWPKRFLLSLFQLWVQYVLHICSSLLCQLTSLYKCDIKNFTAQSQSTPMSWYPLHILCSFNAKNIQKYRLKSFRWVNCSKFTGITPNNGALLRLLNFSRILLQYLIWNLLPKKNLFDLLLISTKYAFWPFPKFPIIEKLIFVIARTLSLFHCKTPQKHLKNTVYSR